MVHSTNQDVCYGLVSVIISSWWNDVSLYRMGANKMQHGSHDTGLLISGSRCIPGWRGMGSNSE